MVTSQSEAALDPFLLILSPWHLSDDMVDNSLSIPEVLAKHTLFIRHYQGSSHGCTAPFDSLSDTVYTAFGPTSLVAHAAPTVPLVVVVMCLCVPKAETGSSYTRRL